MTNPLDVIGAGAQIVTHYEVYSERPSECDLLMPAIAVHKNLLHRSPYLVTADAALFSQRNETAAHARGVKRVAIPNRSTKSAERKQLEKEALVPQRPEVAYRMRRPHQSSEAPTRSEPLPLQGFARYPALGRSWRHRR